jgi:hypothetical protein
MHDQKHYVDPTPEKQWGGNQVAPCIDARMFDGIRAAKSLKARIKNTIEFMGFFQYLLCI